MTKEQFLSKVEELLPDLNELIREKAQTLLNSGAVDLESYSDNFLLPKIFISAMGEEIKNQFAPPIKKEIKVRDNIVHFL
jgi:hypothetical protein